MSSLRVQSVTPADILDYYEEAIKVKCREHMPITSLSQDRRTGGLFFPQISLKNISVFMIIYIFSVFLLKSYQVF